jgi:hypothetical protein
MMIEVEVDTPTIESGAQSICLGIAGIRIALRIDDPTMRVMIDDAAGLFAVDEETADASISAAWGELRDVAFGEMLFDSGALWQLYRDGDAYLCRFQTPHYGATPYKLARFNHDFTEGEVVLHRPYFASGDTVNPLEYPLDELLMLNLLARGRGVELHSCGIVDETGEGYLFIGQSGAGKTTTARIWEQRDGVKILSDDRIIVRRGDDGQTIWMYGTPWHGEGELSCPERAPLKRIFFLRHGREHRLERLGRSEASARLFSCSFPTFYYPDGLDFTLSFFDEMTSAVPCSELTFVPDESVVDFVRQQEETMNAER